jgi:hypothetical protein
MRSDLVDDAALLLELAQRDSEAALASAEASIVDWSHGSLLKSHRPLPLGRERGFPYAAPKPGMPETRRNVRVFGLDGAGEVVYFEDYQDDDGRVVMRAAVLHEGDLAITLAVMRDPEGAWRTESVGYERWNDGRVETTGGADRRVEGVEREDYVYDARGEIDSIVQLRNWSERGYSNAYAIESRRVWSVVRDENGKLEVVLDGSDVAWRRRRPEHGKLFAAAENGLVRDLAPVIEGHPVVELRHQDDGYWTDQLQVELFAGAETLPWSPSPSTAAATSRLDELGEPKPGAARRLLRTVAKRLAARPGAPRLTVSGYDEP